MDEADPQAANERPDPAVVVVIGQVQEIYGKVVPPLGVARMDGRVHIADRPWRVDPHAPEIAECHHGPLLVGEIREKREQVAVHVAPPAIAERRDLSNQVARVAQLELNVGKTGAHGILFDRRGRPEPAEDHLLHVGRPVEIRRGLLMVSPMVVHLGKTFQTAMPEDLVVQDMITAGKQIGPIARLGDLK